MLRRALIAAPLILAGLLLFAGGLTPAAEPAAAPPAAAASNNDLCALSVVANRIQPVLAGVARPGESPADTGLRISRALQCSFPPKRSAAFEARACTALTDSGIRRLGQLLDTPTAPPDAADLAAARRAVGCEP